jgi:hypothetical protein
MGRWIQVLLAALVVGVATTGVSYAGVPNPSLSTVPNIVISPNGAMETMIVVVGDQGAIDTAVVQIVVSTEAAGLICWCTGQTEPVITGTTNPSGEVSFFIAGGGCFDPAAAASPPVVEVFANGYFLKQVGIVSVDAVDGAGVLPTDPGYSTGGLCTAGLSDATFHTGPLKNGIYSFCTDFDSDLDCDLDDAVAITPGIKTGATCTEAP